MGMLHCTACPTTFTTRCSRCSMLPPDPFFVCVGLITSPLLSSICIGCVCLSACGLKLQRWYTVVYTGLRLNIWLLHYAEQSRLTQGVGFDLLTVNCLSYRGPGLLLWVTVRFRSPGRGSGTVCHWQFARLNRWRLSNVNSKLFCSVRHFLISFSVSGPSSFN